MNMHLSSVAAILSLNLLVGGLHTAKASIQELQRAVSFSGCNCKDLECKCCASIDLTNTSHRDLCMDVKLIPNEITLRASVTINGKSVYTGQLDPSLAPICPAVLGGICLTINHVDIKKRQVCVKLSATVFTLLKFPCIGHQNGKLAMERNTYS